MNQDPHFTESDVYKMQKRWDLLFKPAEMAFLSPEERSARSHDFPVLLTLASSSALTK